MRVALIVVGLLLFAALLSGCAERENVWQAECSTDEWTDRQSCSVATAVWSDAFDTQIMVIVSETSGLGVSLAIAGPEGDSALGVDLRIGVEYESYFRVCQRNFCIAPNPAAAIEKMRSADSMRIRLITAGRDDVITDIGLDTFEEALAQAPPLRRALAHTLAREREPREEPAIALPPHTVSDTRLPDGRRVQVDVEQPISEDECFRLLAAHRASARPNGQVTVHGAILIAGARTTQPLCTDNLDSSEPFLTTFFDMQPERSLQ